MKRLLLLGALLGVALSVAIPPAEAAGGRLIVGRSVRIDEPVAGDLVCIGGVVELGPHARVAGDVITVYGHVKRAGGAVVHGRVIEVSSLAGLQLSAEGARGGGRIVWGMRALIWGVWLFVAVMLTWLWPVPVGRGVWIVRHMRLRSLAVGLMAVVTLLAALVAAIAMGPAVGVPVGGALVVVFLGAKAFGLSVLGTLAGRIVLLHGFRVRVPQTYEASVGVTLLVGMRLLPWIGGGIWAIVSLWAVGAAVMTPVLEHAVVPSAAAREGALHQPF